MLISEKIDFKTKNIKKGSVHISTFHNNEQINSSPRPSNKNVYVSINKASKYMPSKITD